MKITIKLIVGFLLINIFTTKVFSQETKLTLNFRETELINILDKIEEKTGFYFLFNVKLIDTNQKLSLNIVEQKIEDVLTALFEKTNIKYTIIDNRIILAPASRSLSQIDNLVTGIVVDEHNYPLAGVNINISGTNEGTITDKNGTFSLISKESEVILTFAFIGYQTQQIRAGIHSPLTIQMAPSVSTIDEVIIIGYGSLRKTDLTGSISTVEQKSYRSHPVSRVYDILQGRTAGLNVTNVSGAPGGATTLRIRGPNSITGNNEPLYVIDGFVGEELEDINPTDIETIQVLKDASSTAIYGSRGANGVVLITTKSGSSRIPKLTVTGRYFTSNTIKFWPLLKANEYTHVVNERADALGYTRPFTEDQVEYYSSNDGTNWQDLIFRNAQGEEIQLNYSGENDRTNFFISGNLLRQEGIIINSNYKRYSLRTNVEVKLTENVTSTLKINYARRETNNTSGNYTTLGVVAAATAWAPTTPAYDENGDLTTADPSSSVKPNPIELATNDNITESNTTNAVGDINYRITKGLTFDIGFGASYNNTQTKTFTQYLLINNPSASRTSTESIFLQNTNMLTYNNTFNNRHNLQITSVVEFQYQKSNFFSATASGLLFPRLKYNNLNLAKGFSLSNGTAKSTIGSYIGRINYNYREKYIAAFSVRNDRSSKFRGKNQTSTFPSVGFGWRISNEDFMRNVKNISYLKLRSSWGITGSQAIDVYGTVTSYNTNSQDVATSWQNGTSTPGINIGNPGNENLKWETTTQTNIGFDAGFLNNHILMVIDYFIKNTKDILLEEPLPGYVGGGIMYNNIGKVSNTGFELSLDALILEKDELSWNMNLTFSYLDNKVNDLGATQYIVKSSGAGAGQVPFPDMILKPGHCISSYYGYRSLGIWQTEDAELAAKYGQQPGDYRYEDVNGDYTLNGKDFQIIGSGIPKKIFGFNNTIYYKGFTFNALIQSMLDYQKWNFAYAQIMIAAADAREYTHRDILNRWSPNNPTSRVAAFNPTNTPQIQSSEYIESGNYLRLKNISLQYTFPENLISWGELSAMISTQNLITITNYKGLDPETYSNVGSGDQRGGDGGAYPNAKTWSLGLTLNF